MNELIGKKFRRNKYGLSVWEDTIKEVGVRYSYFYHIKKEPGMSLIDYIKKCRESHNLGYTVHPYVRGDMNNSVYDLNEIVIYHEPKTDRNTRRNNQ